MTINFPQPASLNPGGGGVGCYLLSVLHLLHPLCHPQDKISSCTPKLDQGLSSPCSRKNVNKYKGKGHRMPVIGPKQVSVRMGLQAAKLSPVRWSRVALESSHQGSLLPAVPLPGQPQLLLGQMRKWPWGRKWAGF